MRASFSSRRLLACSIACGVLAIISAFSTTTGSVGVGVVGRRTFGGGRPTTSSCQYYGCSINRSSSSSTSSTQLHSFMGSDGGILGVGTPELFTILLVGYFVLGPSDLYKLVKEIGKFIQNFRTFTTEATSSLENNLESQLQLEEIRKAQRELNDAFSFRRSINVDESTDPFEVNVQSERPATTGAGAAVAAATAEAEAATTASGEPVKKKKIRRRVKKKQPVVEEEEEPFCVPGEVAKQSDPVENIPDLDYSPESAAIGDRLQASEDAAIKALEEANEELRREQELSEMAEAKQEATMGDSEDEEAALAKIRQERIERLKNGQPEMERLTAEEELAAENRFQQQLNGSWNDQIVAKTKELSPLAQIMDRLAILEEEKNAADMRLQEEFRMREENEEQFYREKRKLLEDAAAEIQASAYASTESES